MPIKCLEVTFKRLLLVGLLSITSAIMYFGINDSKEFANKCSMELLEEKTFFPEALKMLGKKLSFVTKVSMKVAEKKKQVIILRLKLN